MNKQEINITAELVYYEILDFLKTSQLIYNLGFTAACLPNKTWLLTVLHTLNSKHPIFNFTFTAPPNANVELLVNQVHIASEDFKHAKHPAYCKYLHMKSLKREQKRNYYSKYKTEITNTQMNKINSRVSTLERLNNLEHQALDAVSYNENPEAEDETTLFIQQIDTSVFNRRVSQDAVTVKSYESTRSRMQLE